MKHGPIALIDEDMPVVMLCPRDAHYDKRACRTSRRFARARGTSS